MARGGRKTGGGGEVKSMLAKDEMLHGVSSNQFQKFSTRYRTLKQKMDDVRGEMSTLMQQLEEAGYNKAAFKAVHKLAGQDVEKSADYSRHFSAYAKWSGLQLDLFGGEEAEGEAEAAETDKALDERVGATVN